jgi:peptidoglycan/LPS O-acetylase OafA/YrhL
VTASSGQPNSKFRTLELDFIRGLAIIMVIGYHFEEAPLQHPILRLIQTPFKLCGSSGVDMFFVLSGFLVGGLLIKEFKERNTVDSKRFILRRGLKIWPAYYFYILFQAVARKHPLNTFFWQNMFHLQNYTSSSLEHTWSLSVEEHFYLLLTFALGWMVTRHWPMDRILKTFLYVMAIVLVVRCVTVFESWPGAAFYTHDRIDSLLAGVVLAGLFHFYPATFEQIASRKWLLAAIVALAVAFRCLISNQKIEESIGFTIIYLGYAALLILVYRHSGQIKQWGPYRWIARIGLYSYGIYLWHNAGREPTLALTRNLPDSIRWPLVMIGEFSIAIFLGVVTTHLVEWPLLKIRDRMFPARARLVLDPRLELDEEAEAKPAVSHSPEPDSSMADVLVHE